MYKNILICLSLFISNYALAEKIAGSYDCIWINKKTGQPIKGVMVLKKQEQTYTMRSHYDDDSSYIGTGIYNKTHHLFSMGFYNPNNKKEIGITIVAHDGKKFDNTWTWTYMNESKLEYTSCSAYSDDVDH